MIRAGSYESDFNIRSIRSTNNAWPSQYNCILKYLFKCMVGTYTKKKFGGGVHLFIAT